MLDTSVNYIVSGLERSGTSMLMQILDAGGVPIGYDTARPPDQNNPKGYYELEGGKIINKLMEGSVNFNIYMGKFIKITAYGLKFLPSGKYRIIYSERDLEEILDSMEKMAQIKDENRDDTRSTFQKLNAMIKSVITEREDIQTLFVNYNEILQSPRQSIQQIVDFIDVPGLDVDSMVAVVDARLYRQRR